MDNHVYWIIELAIQSGKLEDFKTLMSEMVTATQNNELDTLNYEWNISSDNKTCHVYERYASSTAVMKHLGTFGEKFAGQFLEAVTITRFTVYGNPGEEAKAALNGIGAVFMTPIGGFAR